jgi:outer membrane lipoprotein-sorting protein
MRKVLSSLAMVAVLATPLSAQTADEIIARHIRAIGGMEHIQAVTTMRATGKITGGGGFEATVVQESKRPNKVRSEFTLQGMTGITAYDGQAGWKISPFEGKKDAESLGEDELKSIVEDADFDGPLINYQQKGNRVELMGTDQVEGTDVYKLKVTLPSGSVRIYYLDTDNCIPIKIEIRRTIRGAEQAFEMSLGNYKAVAGWLLPHSMETRRAGSSESGGKVTIDSIEANVPIDDSRFARPAAPAPQPPAGPRPTGEIDQ